MPDRRNATVTVGLDVHASTVVLAAVRGAERTLPTDNEALASTLARWPGARTCYEAGPDSACTAISESEGSPARWSRRRSCRGVQATGSRPTAATHGSSC